MSASAKSERVDLRIPPDQKRLLEQAAALRGQSLSDFIRSTAIEGARAVVRRADVTILSTRDRDRFLAILDDDAPPNAALRRAARHYKAAVGD